MNAIEQWKAKGTPYNEGVLLYASFPSHNKVLLKNFQKKQSPQLLEKLKYELSKIDHSEKAVVPVKKEIAKKTTIGQNVSKNEVVQYIEQQQIQHTTKQALYFHELPEELRPTLLEANTIFKEMCLLKVQLNELPAEAENKALQLQIEISQKQKRNALCWEKLDYWKTHKVAPKEAKGKFETLSPANLVKQEQYLFASISKMKKRLELNRELLKIASGVVEVNKIQRTITKQESSLIAKNEELLKIKALINGEG
ncbi:MAG: hypothetical protein RSE15_00775 [Flavobacterium sp.]|uniref:hypothetical protein n=1 Tax=Flavobacterium sp. TaxID=239 RepID=UPI002B47C43B|nr:hypothetical protein [Flavobacterium sp.]WRH73381.1 MAG: hypothetical protein RSE15_00775 [Flavobacterium sp.]